MKKITKPVESDLEELLLMWRQQYEYHHIIDPIYYASYSKTLEERIRSYLLQIIKDDDTKILIARNKDSNLLGFITFGVEVDEYFDANIDRYGVLKEVFVSEHERGRGVGKELIQAAEALLTAQNIFTIMVQCSSFNSSALEVYCSLGYVNRQNLLYKTQN